MKQKLTLLLLALITTMGAWATTYTITYGTQTGTFYNGSGSAVKSGWIAKWVSNEANKPVVTLTASANNINAENGRMASGQSTTCTYTLYVEAGYKVTGFSMNCPTFGADVTITPTGESATTATTGNPIVVSSSAASFVYSGSNSGRIQAGSNDGGSFTITVEEEDYWAPSIEGAFLTVGNKVSSFTAATAADDNDHWYILTQVRGGETPMYNTGAATARLMRASSPFTLSSLDGALTSTNSAYLIRFKSVGEGTYNIQFANGYWIDGNLNAANFNTAGTYAFYNCNGGSGSYFGWNKDSNTGSKVDNNGAGNTVAFYESGTVSGNSGNNVWYMYETEVEVPASTIDVTYEQYVDGAATGTTYTQTVLPNSAINVPSSFYTGYSSLAYDYSTSGTIADADVTIQVNIDRKSDVKLPAELSNSKKYQIICERGGLSTYYDEANSRTVLASPVKTGLGVSAKEFAILNYDSKYYLYSVSDNKFVTYQEAQIAPLADMITGTSDAIAFSQTTNSVFVIRFDNDTNKNLNSSADYTYGIVINNWGSSSSNWDGGCQYVIKEVGEFDATSALAALNDYFNGPTAFANAIAQLENYPYGTGLNHYSLVVENTDYTTQATTIISSLKAQGYSKENLATAQMLLDGTSINIPTTGAFYRFKSNATSKYIGFAESGKQPMVNAENACIYFYTASKHFLSYNKGRYLSGGTGNSAATIGSEGAAFNFYESSYSSKTFGTYRIRVADDSYGSLIDWTDNFLNGWGAGDNARCEWTIEAVDELPITMNEVDNKYYGTINLPVAVTIPEGVYAYKAAVVGDVMTLTKVVEKGVLAANTPVVLYSASEVTSLAISAEAGTGADDDDFSGTTAAITAPAGTNYVLSKSSTEGVGFYKYTGSVIPGFKAYFNVPSGSPVKGFSFSMEDVETAIRAIESENNDLEIYDIAGRRVPQAQKGLYIVNGKKVMFK